MKQITLVLLDRTSNTTEHYPELLWEELKRRLADTHLWVANLEVRDVQDQEPQKDKAKGDLEAIKPKP